MSYRNFSPEDICRKLDIPALNPMQEKMITASREEDRLMLLSATGSGKTLAFLLPILDQMDPEQKGTQAMVIAPSRELAMQIGKVFQSLGSGFKLTLCYGGHAREIEENSLTDAPALIIGTPGRLADHLRRQNITVDTIKMLVLDEFDKTLELGFQDEVYQIIAALPAVEKKLLVSATRGADLPEGLEVDDPVVVDFLPETEEPETSRLALQQVLSPEKDKSDTLFRLVCALGARPMIVFCNHREAVERTGELLKEKGISCVYYHGAMEQRDRDIALCKFRNGSVYILVTTDIAARGLDVPHIRYIIHYHLPHTEDIFTHRNGRTARMEASGTGIVILGPEEELPEYMDPETEIRELPDEAILPEKPKWTTLFVAAGKKNKVNKTDILGFLAQKGELKREDIGLIEVGDFNSYVAVRKSKVSNALQQIRDHRLKNKNVRIEVAK